MSVIAKMREWSAPLIAAAAVLTLLGSTGAFFVGLVVENKLQPVRNDLHAPETRMAVVETRIAGVREKLDLLIEMNGGRVARASLSPSETRDS